MARLSNEERCYGRLTERESQVLKLISEGFSNQEIAISLGRSIRTIEAHRARLMIKLNIFDVPGLVKFALREGITSLSI